MSIIAHYFTKNKRTNNIIANFRLQILALSFIMFSKKNTIGGIAMPFVNMAADLISNQTYRRKVQAR